MLQNVHPAINCGWGVGWSPALGVTVVVLILVTQIGNTFGGLVIFGAIRGFINRGF
jgi:formate/nitrite transporter FocA (FNT family)